MVTRLAPGSIRARVTVLLIVSTLPLLIAAVLFAAHKGELTLEAAAVLGTSLTGIVVAVVVTDYAVSRPLRVLTNAVEHWKGGGAFQVEHLAVQPVEIAHLARAFSEATRALAEHEKQLGEAAANQELLMREIHHRVKNNLQIVASLLNLQASRIRLPAVKSEFLSARDRVHALGTLHRHLYGDGGLRSINMRSFLAELCGQLFQAMGEREGDRIILAIEAPELEVSSDQAVPLALIVTEAVGNALKYAFPDGRKGRIGVHLTARSDTALLSIDDDGIGIPEGAGESESGPRNGLGIELIRGFARQLSATLEIRHVEGTQYDLRIPLRSESRPGAGSAVPEATKAL